MASANDEWSQITDINERRKVQNRVAQKTYRKRQKMRIKLARAVLSEMPHLNQVVEEAVCNDNGATVTEEGQDTSMSLSIPGTSEAVAGGREERVVGISPMPTLREPSGMPVDARQPSTTKQGMASTDEFLDFGSCSDMDFGNLYDLTDGSKTSPLDPDWHDTAGASLGHSTNWSEMFTHTPPETSMNSSLNPASSSLEQGRVNPSDLLSGRRRIPWPGVKSPGSTRRATSTTHASPAGSRAPSHLPSPSSASSSSVTSAATMKFAPLTVPRQESNASPPPPPPPPAAQTPPSVAPTVVDTPQMPQSPSFLVDIANPSLNPKTTCLQPADQPVSPLLTAIQLGNLQIIRLLVRSGAKVDVPDENGMTALHLAVRKGHLSMVRVLLDLGADVLTTDANGRGLLHTAVERDDLDVVNELLLWCDGQQQQDAGAGATHNALLDPALRGRDRAGTGAGQLVQKCLNAQDRRRLTPVHLCVALERVEILKTLLDYGADVNIAIK